MQTSLEGQIRDELRLYVSGQVPLSTFEEWLVAMSWNIHQTGDVSAMRLAYEIDLRLAEYANGHRTEDELKWIFQPLLDTIVAHVGGLPPPRTGSSSVTNSIKQPVLVGT
jgi:hypothetical protein